MIFRNIIFASIIAGVIAGFALGLIQAFSTTETILAAEVYEIVEEQPAAPTHGHEASATDHHDPEAWGPEDGAERTSYTFLADLLAGIGFAILLISLMTLSGKGNVKNGWLWGLAGFATFFFIPALGLVPEIPGMEAANLQGRQGWWVMTVALTGLGFWLIAFGHINLKVAGLVLLALPHILGAPLPDTHGFSHPDPAAVLTLESLASQFEMQTMIANAVFWLLLGTVSGFMIKKFGLVGGEKNQESPK